MENLPGHFYQRNQRWWWRVRLPGAEKAKNIPLKPIGAKYATKDKAVAVEVARLILGDAMASEKPASNAQTMADLAAMYSDYAKVYYRRPDGTATSYFATIKTALNALVESYGDYKPEDFGPVKLRHLRKLWIETGRWNRPVINNQINIIKQMFQWAVSHELVPVHIFQALRTVEGLKRGRTEARESKPVKPVAAEHIYNMLPYVAKHIAAMLELQLLTGMRSGELVIMRPCDIDTSGNLWIYTPTSHKTQHHGHKRQIPLGPRCQEILRPYLLKKTDAYCFTPHDADVKYNAKRDRYSTKMYYQAVQCAIKRANKRGNLSIPKFTPHQLRHTAATRIRKEFGLDAARAVLGHRTLNMTNEYAEIDKMLAEKVLKKLG